MVLVLVLSNKFVEIVCVWLWTLGLRYIIHPFIFVVSSEREYYHFELKVLIWSISLDITNKAKTQNTAFLSAKQHSRIHSNHIRYSKILSFEKIRIIIPTFFFCFYLQYKTYLASKVMLTSSHMLASCFYTFLIHTVIPVSSSALFWLQTTRTWLWRSPWNSCSKLEEVRWQNCLVQAMTPATTMKDRIMSENATKRKRKRRRKSLKKIKTSMLTMRRGDGGRLVYSSSCLHGINGVFGAAK